MRGARRSLSTSCALAGAVALAAGCGSSNQFPEDFRGEFEMTRVFADNYMINVGADSISSSECEINCPDPTLTFTSITCRINECTVEGPTCTGRVTLSRMGGRSLSLSLDAVPGASGDAQERRQITCFQLSGSTSVRQ